MINKTLKYSSVSKKRQTRGSKDEGFNINYVLFQRKFSTHSLFPKHVSENIIFNAYSPFKIRKTTRIGGETSFLRVIGARFYSPSVSVTAMSRKRKLCCGLYYLSDFEWIIDYIHYNIERKILSIGRLSFPLD